MNARITLIGIQKALSINEKSFADEWTLTDIESYDKDVLLASIITKCGQFEPIYTNPDYFREMCGYWWKKWERTFTKWFIAFDKEYEPLWDRDGHETVHEDTHDIIDNDTTYSSTVDDDYTAENQVSAYDTSTYQPHDKTIGTDDKTVNDEGTNDTDATKDFDREYHSWGNWGISMTAQKLLESEFKVQYINLYEAISDIFCDELCVRVW